MRNGDQCIGRVEAIDGNVDGPDSFASELFTQRHTSCPHQPAAEGGRSIDARWKSSYTFRRA